MTDKEKHEMMNLRKRVVAQRQEIKRLNTKYEKLWNYLRYLPDCPLIEMEDDE